jgi:L-ascorbate metabolism protein UlaG (beta-lactamase superfamily)
MHVTHFGHACLLVRTGDARLLLDPGVFSTGFEDLTGLDAILITHLHVDHVDGQRLPALLENNPGVALLTEPGLAAELADSGLDARSLPAGDGAQFRGATVRAVGGQHAVIHADIPRVGNVGLVIGAEGEPTLFHPGDTYEAVPSTDEAPAGVDVLAFPLNAPWAALKETVEFLRAVQPRMALPIHDGLLAERGRALYVRVLGELLPEETAIRDLAGLGEVELT